MFSCKLCEVFKNTYLKKHLWTNASESQILITVNVLEIDYTYSRILTSEDIINYAHTLDVRFYNQVTAKYLLHTH